MYKQTTTVGVTCKKLGGNFNLQPSQLQSAVLSTDLLRLVVTEMFEQEYKK